MSFENWLSKQPMSPISPEACYAELAWQDGYSKALGIDPKEIEILFLWLKSLSYFEDFKEDSMASTILKSYAKEAKMSLEGLKHE